MHDLVFVKIAYNTEQLMKETVGMLAMVKIVGMMFHKLVEGLTVDIVHQDAIGCLGCIMYQVGMFKTVAGLKLFM